MVTEAMMRRGLLVLIVLIAAFAVGTRIPLRRMLMGMLLPPPINLYPRAPTMPPVVSEATESLLAKYERILVKQSPTVLVSLQPGLADAEIDALETKHHIKLTPDLRSLYRWRNGTQRAANIHTFPNHKFVPLDQVLTQRDEYLGQLKTETPEQQRFHAAYAGHRDAWVGLIVDLAGDGYFFDPGRSEAEGSFFFCFAETGSYDFFPAFRNYLAAVIEGYNSGVFTFDARGANTSDFERARVLFSKYGAENVMQ